MNEITYGYTLSPGEYNELRESVGWMRITEKQAGRGLSNSTFLVAARTDERIVGMGRVLFDYGYTAYIGDVIVRPEMQGKGIGRKVVELLMGKVVKTADPGDRIMFILGAAKGKEGFYEKLGFEVRPSDSSGPGMMKWVKVE